ncbi:tellurium resistance protein [Umezawaea sp. NPDC059074]|uniref:TerD family protein n=1 Tax=Umezawaea sp. NPDC059074 TaxID=3346716 RepID=UPI0036745CDD
MAIDYTKRSRPVSLNKITLTRSARTVSLAKQSGTTGVLRVNLNWNARPAKTGFFDRFTSGPAIDLDLGCLYEFADGSKGVVQALGNAFTASPDGVRDHVIRLDGDDRSGANSGGENLFIDLRHVKAIRRVLVFAFIYEGVPNWAEADGVVTLHPVSGPQVEVRLDEPRAGARMCAVAMLEPTGDGLSVRHEVTYLNGGQRLLDETYGWGLRWTAGSK